MSIATIAKIILVMMLWAACFPLIAAGIEFAPHMTFAALRAFLAGVTLTLLAVALRRPLPKEPQIWAMVAIVGLGATTLGFVGMFHAAEFVSPGIATVIANTQPLLAAVLAGAVLNERLNAHGKVGLLLGFVGILAITSTRLFSGGQENYIIGVAYITLAALGITVSNVLIKRIAGKVDALMAMGLQMLIGSIPLALSAWTMEPGECLQFPDPNLRLDDGVPVLRRDFGLAATSWHCAHNSRCGLGHASWNKVFRGRYLINRAGPAAPQIIFSGNAPVFKTQVLSLWVGLNQN